MWMSCARAPHPRTHAPVLSVLLIIQKLLLLNVQIFLGASKPTYDIWGDTVNVASRLESSGVLGRIHVTEQVAQLLLRHGEFELDCRGPIEVKGKGRLTTYLVVTPFDCTDLDRSADPQDATELGLDEALELEPPPTLEAGDEVEELCADEEH